MAVQEGFVTLRRRTLRQCRFVRTAKDLAPRFQFPAKKILAQLQGVNGRFPLYLSATAILWIWRVCEIRPHKSIAGWPRVWRAHHTCVNQSTERPRRFPRTRGPQRNCTATAVQPVSSHYNCRCNNHVVRQTQRGRPPSEQFPQKEAAPFRRSERTLSCVSSQSSWVDTLSVGRECVNRSVPQCASFVSVLMIITECSAPFLKSVG